MEASVAKLRAWGSNLEAGGAKIEALGGNLGAPRAKLETPGTKLEDLGAKLEAPGAKVEFPEKNILLQAPEKVNLKFTSLNNFLFQGSKITQHSLNNKHSKIS